MKHTERNKLTQQHIKEAFITLIETKGFNSLTVSDITRAAGISRGTFYVHYPDKFALLDNIEEELYLNIVKTITDNFDDTLHLYDITDIEEISASPYSIFIKALDYVYSERRTIRALLLPEGHPQFFDRIKLIVDDTFTQNLIRHNGHYLDVFPIDYTKEIVLNSMLNIVRHWLNKENPESPHELATILMKSRFLAPYQLMIFNPTNKN